ncbi:MAG: ribosome silencing factor [Streptococcaceae bacterium]|nr:ribosome silencing factor [Streptococcaceae bacterium]
MTSKEILKIVVSAADSKRAVDTVALDLTNISPVADYFVITEAGNERQLSAIVDEIIDKIEENGGRVARVEGREGKSWILVDLIDVVVHVFTSSEREHYNIEKLWSDAPLVDIHEWVE